MIALAEVLHQWYTENIPYLPYADEEEAHQYYAVR